MIRAASTFFRPRFLPFAATGLSSSPFPRVVLGRQPQAIHRPHPRRVAAPGVQFYQPAPHQDEHLPWKCGPVLP
jgi:hypothetical protein